MEGADGTEAVMPAGDERRPVRRGQYSEDEDDGTTEEAAVALPLLLLQVRMMKEATSTSRRRTPRQQHVRTCWALTCATQPQPTRSWRSTH